MGEFSVKVYCGKLCARGGVIAFIDGSSGHIPLPAQGADTVGANGGSVDDDALRRSCIRSHERAPSQERSLKYHRPADSTTGAATYEACRPERNTRWVAR